MENVLNQGRIGAMKILNLIPDQTLQRLAETLQKELINEKSRTKAKQNLRMLKELRINVNNSLEISLDKLAEWFSQNNSQDKYKFINNTLLLKAQGLADKLSAIEDLEDRIREMLKNSQKSQSNLTTTSSSK